MKWEERWIKMEELGKGGQGKVFRALPKLKYLQYKDGILTSLKAFSSILGEDAKYREFDKFKDSIIEMINFDNPENQGALKILHNVDDAKNPKTAKQRIIKEINAMKKITHYNLISILEVDDDYQWYVSRFYPNGVLTSILSQFSGNVSLTLQAVRPLVEAVALLHREGYVHRDVKPDNIFISHKGDLILGDFGLIFDKKDGYSRDTDTFENVGSWQWMPQWAMQQRLNDVKPSFDVFSLGKVIWAMLSGKPFLTLWYFDKETNNLEKLFPECNEMKLANRLLSKCIVEKEEDCLSDGNDLLFEIDSIIRIADAKASTISSTAIKPCQICGIGFYELTIPTSSVGELQNFGISPAGNRMFSVFVCNHCGNVQLFFQKGDNTPPAWADVH